MEGGGGGNSNIAVLLKNAFSYEKLGKNNLLIIIKNVSRGNERRRYFLLSEVILEEVFHYLDYGLFENKFLENPLFFGTIYSELSGKKCLFEPIILKIVLFRTLS